MLDAPTLGISYIRMVIDLEHLARLLSGKYSEIPIGVLPPEVTSHLKCGTRTVYLSSQTLMKIVQKHGKSVGLTDVQLIPRAFDVGMWTSERRRPNCCGVFYFHAEPDVRFVAAVKATKNRNKIYLSTFHRSARRQTKAMLKKGELLRASRA